MDTDKDMQFSARSIVVAIFLFSFVVVSAFVIHPAFAQTYTNTTNNTSVLNYLNTNLDSNVPHDFHSLMQVMSLEALSSVSCQLVDIDPLTQNHECLGADPQTGKIGYLPHNGGLIGLLNKGIAYTFTIPVHPSAYFAYLHNEFINQTYAATGEGFTNLEPLLTTWVAFRNITYLLFVLAFVIIGIGIMLRIQIDPRTVMTIENQLPKIVIGLVLVTFSYAIAGFLIDMMWILVFFVINVMQSADPGDPFAQNATIFLFQIPMEYFDKVYGSIISHFTGGVFAGGGILFLTLEVTGGLLRFVQNVFVPATTNQLHVSGVPGLPGNACQFFNPGSVSFTPPSVNWPTIDIGCLFTTLIGNIIDLILTTFIYLIGWLIVLIAILIMLIRLWIALLKTYVMLIITIVLAPFFIIGGVIPGGTFGFGSWMKQIIGHLLVFPAVVFIFLLAMVLNDRFVFLSSVNGATGNNTFFTPPLVGNPADSSLIGGNGSLNIPINPLGVFLVLGVLMIAPSIPNTINKVMGNEGLGVGAAAFAGSLAGLRIARSVGSSVASSGVDPQTGRIGAPNIRRLIGSAVRR